MLDIKIEGLDKCIDYFKNMIDNLEHIEENSIEISIDSEEILDQEKVKEKVREKVKEIIIEEIK